MVDDKHVVGDGVRMRESSGRAQFSNSDVLLCQTNVWESVDGDGRSIREADGSWWMDVHGEKKASGQWAKRGE